MGKEHILVYRVCNTNFVRPHNGYGSTMRNGGRWNSNKYPCIYTGANRSIAQLEWVSHWLVNEFDFPNLTMITYAIPKDQIYVIDSSEYPGWIDNEKLTTQIGDEFLRQKAYVALCVPSAMDSKELNYIINPNHPDFLTAKMVVNDDEVLVLNERFFEVKEFVKKALRSNLSAKLNTDAELARYISENKSGPVYRRPHQRRPPKK
jgi:RES domain-containing protein